MKTTHLFLVLAAVIIFVSCQKKQQYELHNVSHPLLNEWYANFKAADSSFSAEKFKPVFYSHGTQRTGYAPSLPNDWYDDEPCDLCWLIFSPDSSFFLNLDFYSGLPCEEETNLLWHGGDDAVNVILTDVRNKKSIQLIKTNNYNGADDAFWVNDSIFVMLCQDYDFNKEVWFPYISIWNKEIIIAKYLYDGTINNYRDEQFSPFYNRLRRLGIKVNKKGD